MMITRVIPGYVFIFIVLMACARSDAGPQWVFNEILADPAQGSGRLFPQLFVSPPDDGVELWVQSVGALEIGIDGLDRTYVFFAYRLREFACGYERVHDPDSLDRPARGVQLGLTFERA